MCSVFEISMLTCFGLLLFFEFDHALSCNVWSANVLEQSDCLKCLKAFYVGLVILSFKFLEQTLVTHLFAGL